MELRMSEKVTSFINTKEQILNLKNVSNVNVITERNRIVFNLNFNIEIPQKNTNKKISAYVYWDGDNLKDLDDNLKFLEENEYFKNNFIKQLNSGFINKNEISSVKFLYEKKRVIFNLSHPVHFYDSFNKEKMTSEFVYVNCKNDDVYNDYAEYVKSSLL
jgi:hypothetical protein